MYSRLLLLLLPCLPPALSVAAAPTPDTSVSGFASQPLRVERLPSLHVARHGHTTLATNQGILVVGGHTTDFVPTPTAEWLYDGEWHLVPTAYTHDHGLALHLRSGEVIVAGGHEQPLGIGQTFTFETTTPATTTKRQRRAFQGYGCLDRKRCFARALEMDSGHVIISGNWYQHDDIECYDGSRQCHHVKDVAQQRALPYILRTSHDNAIIFSPVDTHANRHDTIVIDRLVGDPFTEPLLQTWRPRPNHEASAQTACFIGNEACGQYAYLVTAENAEGQIAFLRVEDEHFSLLPTDGPVPMRSQWGRIFWFSNLVADSTARRAYMVGADSLGHSRLYVLAVDYSRSPALLTLYHTEPQDSVSQTAPVVTPEGNLLLAGGNLEQDNNFTLTGSTLLLCVGSKHEINTATTESWQRWLWLLLPLVILLLVWKTHQTHPRPLPVGRGEDTSSPETPGVQNNTSPPSQGGAGGGASLFTRICQLMDEQQPYLNPDLKIADVAKALGTNATYVSRCINAERGATFSQFVNVYRISHAQQLLRQQPDMKIAALSTDSGFANETTFFRAFKALTGMTPREWMAQTD